MIEGFQGCYTENLGFVDGKGKGIYRFWYDQVKGDFKFEEKEVYQLNNPSFLIYCKENNCIYSTSETNDGQLYSFSVEKGELKLLNSVKTGGDAPCHVSLNFNKKLIYVANYNSASISVYAIEKDGSIGQLYHTHKFNEKGTNVDPSRQLEKHAHFIVEDEFTEDIYVVDLGGDCFYVFSFDSNKLVLKKTINTAPGMGPRFIDYTEENIYLLGELNSTIEVFKKDFTRIQTISTLPSTHNNSLNNPSHIKIWNNKFVYSANRFGDTIAIFEISKSNNEEERGKLNLLGHEFFNEEKTCRYFHLSQNHLIAGLQDSHSVIIYNINPQTGLLTFLSKHHSLSPTCFALVH